MVGTETRLLSRKRDLTVVVGPAGPPVPGVRNGDRSELCRAGFRRTQRSGPFEATAAKCTNCRERVSNVTTPRGGCPGASSWVRVRDPASALFRGVCQERIELRG